MDQDNACNDSDAWLCTEELEVFSPKVKKCVIPLPHCGNDITIFCTNTDQVLTGALNSVKAKNKSIWNFRGLGFFGFSLPSSTRKGYQGKDFSYVQVLDIPTVATCFKDPVRLADQIEARCRRLVTTWNKHNSSPSSQGQRRKYSFNYKLAEHKWDNEFTICQLILNTFLFTTQTQTELRPTITLEDIQVLIKMKSTVNKRGKPEVVSF